MAIFSAMLPPLLAPLNLQTYRQYQGMYVFRRFEEKDTQYA